MKCQLCQEDKLLCDSHIIPAFVYRWIKETSATGFLRSFENINLRVQDGKKQKLLCKECEGILNTYETQFSKEIFYPYVNKELDQYGIAKGNIKSFKYKEWLLKFIISIHWRVSIIDSTDDEIYVKNHKNDIKSYLEKWRLFLLGSGKSTGLSETHLIFLQNLAAADERLPENISDKIVFYLLRATDGTIIFTEKKLGVFSKIGPIAFYTFIKPPSLKKANDTKIHLRGNIETGQKISHPDIVDFLFIKRPNEIFSKIKFSDRQKKVVEKSYNKNLEKSLESLTLTAYASDKFLKNRKL